MNEILLKLIDSETFKVLRKEKDCFFLDIYDITGYIKFGSGVWRFDDNGNNGEDLWQIKNIISTLNKK